MQAEAQFHRSNDVLWDHWDHLRGEKDYPAEEEIDPDALAEIWDSCFLISIDDVTRRIGYRYSYLGHELVEAYGDDISNPDIAQKLVDTTRLPLIQAFDEVLKTGKPVIDEGEFTNLKHMRIRYRTCMLPLGSAGKVTHIIGCKRWRAY